MQRANHFTAYHTLLNGSWTVGKSIHPRMIYLYIVAHILNRTDHCDFEGGIPRQSLQCSSPCCTCGKKKAAHCWSILVRIWGRRVTKSDQSVAVWTGAMSSNPPPDECSPAFASTSLSIVASLRMTHLLLSPASPALNLHSVLLSPAH